MRSTPARRLSVARLAVPLIVLVLAGCTTPLIVGEECTDSSDCEDGLSCFFSDSTMTTARCMQDCDDTMMRLCSGGEVCLRTARMGLPREEEVCFLGGSTPVGSPCVDVFECAVGAICVIDGTDQSCFRACDSSDGTACQVTETCEALMGMGTNGYCVPMTP